MVTCGRCSMIRCGESATRKTAATAKQPTTASHFQAMSLRVAAGAARHSTASAAAADAIHARPISRRRDLLDESQRGDVGERERIRPQREVAPVGERIDRFQDGAQGPALCGQGALAQAIALDADAVEIAEPDQVHDPRDPDGHRREHEERHDIAASRRPVGEGGEGQEDQREEGVRLCRLHGEDQQREHRGGARPHEGRSDGRLRSAGQLDDEGGEAQPHRWLGVRDALERAGHRELKGPLGEEQERHPEREVPSPRPRVDEPEHHEGDRRHRHEVDEAHCLGAEPVVADEPKDQLVIRPEEPAAQDQERLGHPGEERLGGLADAAPLVVHQVVDEERRGVHQVEDREEDNAEQPARRHADRLLGVRGGADEAHAMVVELMFGTTSRLDTGR